MATKDTLKHLFSHKVKGIIWKIILDDELQIMVIESRTKEKEVYFYAYDFINNVFLLQDKTFDEKWRLGTLSISKGILYLHGYENEHSPTQKQIIAFDVINNKLLWENYTHAVEGIYNEGIVAFNTKITPKRLELFDKKSGVFIKSIKQNELGLLTRTTNDIKLPKDNFDTDLWKSNQTLEHKDLEITSYYKNEENITNQFISVKHFDNIILNDFLNQDIQKLIQDSFFVWLNKLVYIRNKSEIVSYSL